MIAGRTFRPRNSPPGGDPVMVLNEHLRARIFGAPEPPSDARSW